MSQTRRNSKRSHRNRRRRGGMAPTQYSTAAANPQPSERVMQWATTAGAPTPSAAEMRNVAHGGRRKRRTHRRRSNRRRSTHRRR